MPSNKKEVEQRIIEMRFQNAQFKTAAGETMKALTSMDDTLKSIGASAKGFDELGQSLEKIDSSSLSKLSDSVEEIASHFTWFGRTADHAIDHFTNKVAGMTMSAVGNLKSLLHEFLGFDPNLGGFHEYEDMMTSIQTIKTNTASKGTTLEEINAALAELNEYADLTIYNFQEMTRNIGTFTAAGVGLQDSVDAIKGIANLAAGVGSTPQQAANAMYQLSQALAAGTVNLQDWNSVVNAGMGGEYFQNALKETARTLYAQKGMVVETFEGTFRESISGKEGSGWLTSEVLLETLKKFAKDESLVEAATKVKTFTGMVDTMKESVGSGWTTTWQILIGDLDEASDLFTGISKKFDTLIGPIHDSRNEMLQYWKDMGGREKLIQAVSNAFKALESVLRPIHKAWQEAFPPLTGQTLVNITNSLYKMTAGLGVGSKGASRIYTIFSILFSTLQSGIDILLSLSNIGMGALGIALDYAWSGAVLLLDAIVALDSWLSRVVFPFKILGDEIDRTNEKFAGFKRVGRLILTVFEAIASRIATTGAAFVTFIRSIGFDGLINGANAAIAKVKEFYDAFAQTAVGKKVDKIVKLVSSLFTEFIINGAAIKNAKIFFLGFFDAVKNGEGIIGRFQNALNYVKNAINEYKGTVLKDKWEFPFGKDLLAQGANIGDFFKEKRKQFGDSIDWLKTKGADIKTSAKEIEGYVQSFIIPIWDGLKHGISVVKQELNGLTFADLVTIFSAIESFMMFRSIRHVFDGIADVIDGVADIEKAGTKVIEGFVEIFDSVKDTLKSFQLEIKTKALMNIATAVAILSASIFALAFLQPEAALQGVLIVGALLVAMIAAMALLNKLSESSEESKSKFDSMGFLTLGAGIMLVVLSAIKMADLLKDENGEAALGYILLMFGLLFAVAGIASLFNENGNVKKSFKTIFLFAAMLFASVKVIKDLTKIEPEKLADGVGALTVLLIALGTLFKLSENLGDLGSKQGLAILAIAATIGVLTFSLTQLANVPFLMLLKSAAFVLVPLAAIGALLALISKKFNAEDIMGVGVGFAAMGAALIGIAAALYIISLIPIEQLWEAVKALTVIMALLSVAAYFGVLNRLGDAMNAFTSSIFKFIASLAILAIASPLFMLIAAQAEGLKVSLITIGLALIDVIIALGGPLAEAVLIVIIDLLHALNLYIEPLADELYELIIHLLNILGNFFLDGATWSSIGKAISTGFLGLLKLLFGKIPGVGEFFDEWIKDNEDYYDRVIDQSKARKAIEREARRTQFEADRAASKLDLYRKFKGEDQVESLSEETDFIKDGAIAQFAALANDTENALPKAFNLESIADTLGYNATGVIDLSSLQQYVENSSETIGELVPDGLIEGISGGNLNGVYSSSYNLGEIIQAATENALQINSPSKVAQDIAENYAGTLSDTLLANKDGLYRSAQNMTSAITDSVGYGYSDLISESINGVEEPVIRPRFDLTEIQNGIAWMNGNIPEGASYTMAQDISASQMASSASSELANTNATIRDNSQMQLVSVVQEMNATLHSLSERMTKLSVYLDTGTLVGELTDELDRSLGDLTEASIRGGA